MACCDRRKKVQGQRIGSKKVLDRACFSGNVAPPHRLCSRRDAEPSSQRFLTHSLRNFAQPCTGDPGLNN